MNKSLLEKEIPASTFQDRQICFKATFRSYGKLVGIKFTADAKFNSDKNGMVDRLSVSNIDSDEMNRHEFSIVPEFINFMTIPTDNSSPIDITIPDTMILDIGDKEI